MSNGVGRWWGYALLRWRRQDDHDGVPEHAVHVYSDEQGLVDRMERWVVVGHAKGQRTVVFATPERCAALVARLRTRGLEREVDLHDAQTALDQFVVDGVPDPVLFDRLVGAAVRTYPRRGVRAYGEMVSLLWKEGNISGALDLEGLWDELLATVHCPLLCAYDEADVGGRIDDVRRCHSHEV